MSLKFQDARDQSQERYHNEIGFLAIGGVVQTRAEFNPVVQIPYSSANSRFRGALWVAREPSPFRSI